MLDPDGRRTTLIEGLPSGPAAPNNDPSGVSGLIFKNRSLFLAIGAGNSVIADPVPGSEAPNPQRSSPILSSVLELEFDRSLSSVSGGFLLPPYLSANRSREATAVVSDAPRPRAGLRPLRQSDKPQQHQVRQRDDRQNPKPWRKSEPAANPRRGPDDHQRHHDDGNQNGHFRNPDHAGLQGTSSRKTRRARRLHVLRVTACRSSHRASRTRLS